MSFLVAPSSVGILKQKLENITIGNITITDYPQCLIQRGEVPLDFTC